MALKEKTGQGENEKTGIRIQGSGTRVKRAIGNISGVSI